MLFLTDGMLILGQGFIEGAKFIITIKYLHFYFMLLKVSLNSFLTPRVGPFLVNLESNYWITEWSLPL